MPDLPSGGPNLPSNGSDQQPVIPVWPESWNITGADLLTETNSSLIWKAQITGDDASPVIIKQLKPVGMDELRGGYFLQARNGHGAIRLLDMQSTPALMLLEYAGNHHLKDHLQHSSDNECIRIAGQVIAALHSPLSFDKTTELQPLRQHFTSLLALKSSNEPLYSQAATLALTLLDQPHQPIPLHGDLHHENIMLSARGWLAIDPHGLFGDPAFDCTNLFYNPLDRDDLCLDMQRAQIMAKHFSTIIGSTAQHIVEYAFCYGCLSAAWHREDGNSAEEARTLKIATALNHLRQRSCV